MITNATIIAENVEPDVYVRQEPGVNRGERDYVMSRSDLMAFAVCPHKWLAVGHYFEGNDASDWGSAIDCLLLTPGEWDNRFAVKPETYPDSKTGEPKPFTMASNWCKQWAADHEGKILVKHEDFAAMQAAVLALGEVPEVRAILPKARKQVMAVAEWQDKASGLSVPVKVLLDLVPDAADPLYGKVLPDLKTTTNASAGEWASKVYRMNYDAQAALFLDVYKAATGEDRTDFWHIVQETDPPYETAVWGLSAGVEGGDCGFIGLGRMKYESALERYCQCLKTGYWPGYAGAGRTWLQPKPWMLNQ
jgi:hypothetical protein